MDFPSPSLPDLALADLSSLGFPDTTEHPPIAQQLYRDTALYSPPNTQFESQYFTPIQSRNLYPSALPVTPPGHGQQDAGNAQSMPTTPMAPPARPRKRKAPTLSADAWEPYKNRILELHITEKLPLPVVRKKIMEEFNFTAEYAALVGNW